MSAQKPTHKRAPKPLPSAEFLSECLNYHPKSGVLSWKERPRSHFASDGDWLSWNTKHSGKIAGAKHNKGYRTVKIGGRAYLVHRVISKLVTGDEPPLTIDHKDKERSNNIWKNLRPATFVEQTWNSRDYKNNTWGYRCVYPSGSRWKTQISLGGVIYHIGCFATREEASAAYEAAARRLHGEFYRS